ncbi:hypothetical protein ACI2JW_21490 [Serratia ureilytica]|nr:hypothetical protein [Serratia ureilytica]MBH2653667.1 hypothetical protein [Serratia ureilytica]
MKSVIAFLLLLTPCLVLSKSVDFKIEEYGRVDANIWNQYKATLTRWDVTDESTPNPMYGCSPLSCKIYIHLSTENAIMSGGWLALTTDQSQWVSTSKTYAELARRLGVNRVAIGKLFNVPKGTRYCAALGHTNPRGGGLIYMPGSGFDCMFPAIEPTVCNIPEPIINLMHGTVTSNKVNGHTASAVFHVRCNFPFRVRLRSADEQGSVLFNAADGFRSDLSVNGVSLAGKGLLIDATPAGTSVNITSTLKNYSGRMGDFNGVAVIVISAE